EPFPEYYQSCETGDAQVDETLEKAYRFAISKVCEEVIRFRDLDTSVTSPLPFSMESTDTIAATAATAATAVTAPNAAIGGESPAPITAAIDANDDAAIGRETSIARPDRRAPEDVRQEVLKEMRDMLRSKKLKPDTRQRFTAMCNLIIRMEFLLFRQHQTPVDPVDLLSTDEAEEVLWTIAELVKYVTIIDNILGQELAWAQRVHYSVAYIASETHHNIVLRFKNMSEVIISHLKKPRPSEHQLLVLFLDFFDCFLYTDFISSHPRPFDLEAYWDPTRAQLNSQLVQAWHTINHGIENYDAIIRANADIKKTYVAPAFREIEEAPRIWREALISHYVDEEHKRMAQAAQGKENR
ncbi:hypothetical protein BO71DRAFT_284774, partial [Aspergillus ellipticus CBS 707.79]